MHISALLAACVEAIPTLRLLSRTRSQQEPALSGAEKPADPAEPAHVHRYKPFSSPTKRVPDVAMRFRLNEQEPALLTRAIAAIRPDAFAEFRTGYRVRYKDYVGHDSVKYADLAYWLAQKVRVGARIGLDRGPPLAILDIGTGGGHFPAILTALGHKVVGIDVEMPLYARIATVLGVDRRIAPVMPCELLPDLGLRFDAITIHWPAFDVIGGDAIRLWTLDEWLFLLRDLAQRQLVPGGMIHIQLNRHPASGFADFPAHLIAWSVAHGAKGDIARGELRFETVTTSLFEKPERRRRLDTLSRSRAAVRRESIEGK